MKSQGFTLIEILIVITLVGIIIAIAVPNYNDTLIKARIEKQTKELHATIMTARLTAMQNKQPVAIYLGPNQYVYKVYTSADYNSLYNLAHTGFRTVNTTDFPYVLKLKDESGTTLNTLDVTSDRVLFDTRGFAVTERTLVVTPLKFSGGDDCIVVHTSRTNIGRMENASTCRTR